MNNVFVFRKKGIYAHKSGDCQGMPRHVKYKSQRNGIVKLNRPEVIKNRGTRHFKIIKKNKSQTKKTLWKNIYVRMSLLNWRQEYTAKVIDLLLTCYSFKKKLTLQLEFYFYLCHKLFIVTDIYIACKYVSRLILNLH